jgi:hypothetical protein
MLKLSIEISKPLTINCFIKFTINLTYHSENYQNSFKIKLTLTNPPFNNRLFPKIYPPTSRFIPKIITYINNLPIYSQQILINKHVKIKIIPKINLNKIHNTTNITDVISNIIRIRVPIGNINSISDIMLIM